VKARESVPRVALVTHDVAGGGGTGAMCAFLHRVLAESGRFHADVVSLATSARDAASTRLLAPRTWLAAPRVETRGWNGIPCRHVGSRFAELEPWRYRPRRVLDGILESYDLVQLVVGYPAWLTAAARVSRPRLVWTATGARPDRASRIRAAPPHRRAWIRALLGFARASERRALRLADFVFALSPYTLRGLAGQVDPARAALAYCGVDTQLFQPGASSGRYLLSVGRLSDPRKNAALLLEAYAALVARLPDAPDLWIAGEPPTREVQATLAERGLSDRVRLLGVKPVQELAELYRGACAFVLSSDEEGLGIVLLEAMASGLAVVSTRCGGPEAVVEDGVTGVLVPVGDARALSSALATLLGSPERAVAMGRAGRERALRQFSIAATAPAFLDKYDEILHTR
jgi:glycosyltransferase involved in cell wall biosynthesis